MAVTDVMASMTVEITVMKFFVVRLSGCVILHILNQLILQQLVYTSSAFMCDNENHVPGCDRCDGYNGCGDNSDENISSTLIFA